MEKFLILGSGGMLGRAIARACKARGEEAIGLTRAQCDISDEQSLRRAILQHRPTVIINCTGHTRVDACETELDRAMLVNGDAVGALGRAAEASNARVVHFSTDFVFDGSSRRPWREHDEASPLSAYGKSKLHGERALLNAAPGHALVVRTSWLFGYPGGSFPRTIAERAKAGAKLSVVEDQLGSPTFADDLAAATLDLVHRGATGTLHVANQGEASWLEVARATLDIAGIDAAITPTTSAAWKSQYPASAVRPAYSVLDTRRASSILGREMRPWRESLTDFIRQWQSAQPA